MSKSFIQAIDVARQFRQANRTVEALLPASFVVRSGDRIALVGPSGSGKSTLLHLMAGLDTTTGGKLAWPELGTRSGLRPRRIGMVFQTPGLIAHDALPPDPAPPSFRRSKPPIISRRASPTISSLDWWRAQ